MRTIMVFIAGLIIGTIFGILLTALLRGPGDDR